MTDKQIVLPTPLNELVSKALQLCKLMLPVSDVFYPFAALHDNGNIGCLFSDETTSKNSESQLIEQLQWRIIDATTDTCSYSILVYAATVNTQASKSLDAIAIAISAPNNEERLLLYPYYKVDGKVVVSPPFDAVTR